MFSNRSSCIATSLLIIALAGCETELQPVPIAEFMEARAANLCDAFFACCDADEQSTFAGWGATREECIAHFAADASLENSVEADRLEYDALEAARCLEAPILCNGFGMTLRGIDQFCPAAFTALVPDEGECTLPVDCVSGYCEVVGTTGTCRPVGDEGDECGVCAAALFCDRVTAECTEPRENGEACMTSYECESLACTEGVCTDRAPLCDGAA